MNTQKRAWRAISLAATLAATIALAFLIGCTSGRPGAERRASSKQSAAKVISPHLPFGNPSEASDTDPNNQLVVRPEFAASWSAKKRISNWVAWKLVASDVGSAERSQFYADPEIDTPSPKDYTRSGFDRGHLCPSKDRSDSGEHNRSIFTMLNILPQSPQNNRGPWEKAERFERELAQDGREVYIVAGGVGSEGEINGIDVPESTWKVIVALAPGKSFPDGEEKAEVFAILTPNALDKKDIQDDKWQDYQVKVSDIEKKTGYHFFKNSPVIEGIAKTGGRF
jgi:endonuclease G